MRVPYVVLIDHCVHQRCINLLMTKQLLHLLDGHSFSNCFGGQRSPELMWVDVFDACFCSQGAKAELDSAYLQPRTLIEGISV